MTDGTWTYTWQNGRELASMTDGTTTWNYTYDANGMRTSRTNGTKTYSYVYNGSQLVQMTVGNDTLYFTYGALGPATVTWNGTTYYYGLNGQGDVIGIYDNTGYVVVTYNWDTAWGYNPMPEGLLASTLGALNPLRYRSYVYDTETGYYYLQSRYYDPEIGRFINADGLIATGQGFVGNNMFAYCLNDPVNYIDPEGTLAYPGEIHNEVVRRVAAKYGYNKEQYILYKGGGFGRADLISEDGQVWDVKRDKTRQINAGKRQVQKYVENTWLRSPNTHLRVGRNEIAPDGFYYKSGLTTYRVTYRYAGDGVIAYDYAEVKYDYQTLASTLILAGLAAITGIATAGLSSGALAYFFFI